MKVAVIGAGASGLVSAVYAAKEGNKVVLLERNNSLGKKLLITGNGRCNYFNSDMNLKHYYSEEIDILSKIITKENQKEILSFFESIGITPKIKNGYYYPISNKAVSIRDALEIECKMLGIEIITDFKVENIIKKDKFMISSQNTKIEADKVVLALGSKAYPKTGSDGIGYDIALSFGHSVNKVLPSLTGLCTNENYLNLWKGARTEVKLSLYENDNLIKIEEGEAQFTDYGISGICAFNLSSLITKGLYLNKKEEVCINFVPYINPKSIDDVVTYLNRRSQTLIKRTVFELLEGILDYKLINVIIKKSKIDPDKYFSDLSKKEVYHLASNLYSFKINIASTKSFENAQVCMGGVKLSEINPLTMESIIVKNLYITGELLDVNGDCGGYNLAFAFISGMLAGKGTKE